MTDFFDEGGLSSLRRMADDWLKDLSVLSPSVINNLILQIHIKNKNIRSVEIAVFQKEKHVSFEIGVSLWTLLFKSRREKIYYDISELVYIFLGGWDFNVVFKRQKKQKYEETKAR